MIIGAILFFSGIIVSILWAGSFFKTLLNQGMFLADISIPASSFNNNTLQINDIDHPIIIQLHLEKDRIDSENVSSSSSNISNNNNETTTSNIGLIREVVKDPNGKVLSQSNISKEFTTSIKPTVQGAYTLSLYNFGNLPVKIGGVFGSAQFLNQNNQVNFSFFNGAIIGVILIIIGILIFIVGLIIAIMDRKRR
jgi:subtilase family serine protease